MVFHQLVTQALKVLLVEDSPEDAERILEELRRAGYELTSDRVDDLRGIERALTEQRWDLVISDYGMPTLSGLDALRLAQKHAPDVPFILISGSVGEELAVQAMKAGVHDYLFKDRLARLPSAVRRELREAEARRERAQAREERERLLRELEEAVRARDQFIGIASHELKTPLTSLSLHVQKLELLLGAGTFSPESLRPRIELLRRQSERLNALINDLLDVGQLSKGPLQLNRQPISVTQLVREVCARHRDALQRVGCDLTVELQDEVTASVDASRLEQVLGNLLSNAAKYGPGKPVRVALEKAGSELRLSVRDHGIGIDPDDRERIFGRFERAVSDHHYGGLGMGLWIVREIVQAHGGRVGAESVPGAGATFTVLLPRAAA